MRLFYITEHPDKSYDLFRGFGVLMASLDEAKIDKELERLNGIHKGGYTKRFLAKFPENFPNDFYALLYYTVEDPENTCIINIGKTPEECMKYLAPDDAEENLDGIAPSMDQVMIIKVLIS